MTENPLSGISVPSADELASQIIDLFGGAKFDLKQPIHRERLRRALSNAIDLVFRRTEFALVQSQEKAVRHVFNLIRDPEYQQKRLKRQQGRAIERKNKKLRAIAEARKAIHPVTPTIQ